MPTTGRLWQEVPFLHPFLHLFSPTAHSWKSVFPYEAATYSCLCVCVCVRACACVCPFSPSVTYVPPCTCLHLECFSLCKTTAWNNNEHTQPTSPPATIRIPVPPILFLMLFPFAGGQLLESRELSSFLILSIHSPWEELGGDR